MATEKVNLDRDQKFRDRLQKIVEDNCKKIPYEGTEINKRGIIEDIISYLKDNHYSLLRHKKDEKIFL